MNENEEITKKQNHSIEKTPKIDFNVKKRRRKDNKNRKNEIENIKEENVQIIKKIKNAVTPKLTFSSSFNERLSKIGLKPSNSYNDKITEKISNKKKLKASNENSFVILSNNEISFFDSNSDKVDSQNNETSTNKNLRKNNSSKEEKTNSQLGVETQNSNNEPKTNSQESNESNISLLQLPESAFSINDITFPQEISSHVLSNSSSKNDAIIYDSALNNKNKKQNTIDDTNNIINKNSQYDNDNDNVDKGIFLLSSQKSMSSYPSINDNSDEKKSSFIIFHNDIPMVYPLSTEKNMLSHPSTQKKESKEEQKIFKTHLDFDTPSKQNITVKKNNSSFFELYSEHTPVDQILKVDEKSKFTDISNYIGIRSQILDNSVINNNPTVTLNNTFSEKEKNKNNIIKDTHPTYIENSKDSDPSSELNDNITKSFRGNKEIFDIFDNSITQNKIELNNDNDTSKKQNVNLNYHVSEIKNLEDANINNSILSNEIPSNSSPNIAMYNKVVKKNELFNEKTAESKIYKKHHIIYDFEKNNKKKKINSNSESLLHKQLFSNNANQKTNDPTEININDCSLHAEKYNNSKLFKEPTKIDSLLKNIKEKNSDDNDVKDNPSLLSSSPLPFQNVIDKNYITNYLSKSYKKFNIEHNSNVKTIAVNDYLKHKKARKRKQKIEKKAELKKEELLKSKEPIEIEGNSDKEDSSSPKQGPTTPKLIPSSVTPTVIVSSSIAITEEKEDSSKIAPTSSSPEIQKIITPTIIMTTPSPKKQNDDPSKIEAPLLPSSPEIVKNIPILDTSLFNIKLLDQYEENDHNSEILKTNNNEPIEEIKKTNIQKEEKEKSITETKTKTESSIQNLIPYSSTTTTNNHPTSQLLDYQKQYINSQHQRLQNYKAIIKSKEKEMLNEGSNHHIISDKSSLASLLASRKNNDTTLNLDENAKTFIISSSSSMLSPISKPSTTPLLNIQTSNENTLMEKSNKNEVQIQNDKTIDDRNQTENIIMNVKKGKKKKKNESKIANEIMQIKNEKRKNIEENNKVEIVEQNRRKSERIREMNKKNEEYMKSIKVKEQEQVKSKMTEKEKDIKKDNVKTTRKRKEKKIIDDITSLRKKVKNKISIKEETKKKNASKKEKEKIFSSVVTYIIPEKIPKMRRKLMSSKIENLGGKIIDKYSPEILTHIISDIEYEDIIKYLKVESIKKEIYIVKSEWVSQCLKNARLENEEIYKIWSKQEIELLKHKYYDQKDKYDPKKWTDTNDDDDDSQNKEFERKKEEARQKYEQNILQIKSNSKSSPKISKDETLAIPSTSSSTVATPTGSTPILNPTNTTPQLSPKKDVKEIHTSETGKIPEIPLPISTYPLTNETEIQENNHSFNNNLLSSELEDKQLNKISSKLNDENASSSLYPLLSTTITMEPISEVDEKKDLDKNKSSDNNKIKKVINALKPRKVFNQESYICMKKNSKDETVAGPNDDIIKVLTEILNYYQLIKSEWRIVSYQKAIAAIKRYPKKILSYKQAKSIIGIGDGIAKKIEEIINTGTCKKLETFKNDKMNEVLKIFIQIWGVGESTAKKWYDKGYRSIDDIIKNENLTYQQKVGIQLYNEFKERMPRSEAEEISNKVQTIIQTQYDPDLQFYTMGSFRRGLPTCGDIDIIITKNDNLDPELLYDVVKILKENGILTHDLSFSKRSSEEHTKYMGVAQLPGHKHRRIDLLIVPWNELGAALLYFTGSDIFNRSLRLLARKKGWRLNQRGLYANVLRNRDASKITSGVLIASKTEKEIFDALEVPYCEPKYRDA